MSESKRKEYMRQASRTLVPQFYAALGLALRRGLGFGQKRTIGVFEETRAIWEEYEGRASELARDCLEETGIVIR